MPHYYVLWPSLFPRLEEWVDRTVQAADRGWHVPAARNPGVRIVDMPGLAGLVEHAGYAGHILVEPPEDDKRAVCHELVVEHILDAQVADMRVDDMEVAGEVVQVDWVEQVAGPEAGISCIWSNTSSDYPL